MKKVVRDGKVAVLYSPGYGSGWHTALLSDEYIFDPEIVSMVETGKQKEIEAFCLKRLEGTKHYLYFGGADQLEIEWIPEGTSFRINEYDGYESIEYPEQIKFLIA